MSFQQRATDAIRASGGRITSQRLLLLELMEHATDDVNAESLHQLASEHDPNISLPTIYRTLHTLEEAQLISPHYRSSDHERKIYRIVGDRDALHFTCRRCGRVVEFQTERIQQLKKEITQQLGAQVLTLCMCASGLCADCMNDEEAL